MGSTWWLVCLRSEDAHGPHHSSERHDHAQKSRYGFSLLGFFALGTTSAGRAGWRCLFSSSRAATSARREPFFALVPKFFRADEVSVDGLKMET